MDYDLYSPESSQRTQCMFISVRRDEKAKDDLWKLLLLLSKTVMTQMLAYNYTILDSVPTYPQIKILWTSTTYTIVATYQMC